MTVGIVLAGGASSRMGVDKATMSVSGKPMVVHVADALWEAGLQPVECQGGDAATIAQYGLWTVADVAPLGGPLVAIGAALERHREHDVVVVACDLVDLDAGTLRELVATGARHPAADVVALTADGRHHMASWWRRGAADAVGALLASGVDAYHGALERLTTVDLPVDSSLVRNVNSPADLDADE